MNQQVGFGVVFIAVGAALAVTTTWYAGALMILGGLIIIVGSHFYKAK